MTIRARQACGFCFLVPIFLIAGCTNAVEGESQRAQEGPEMTKQQRLEARDQLQPDKRPDAVTTEAAPAVTGEVPEPLLDSIMRDLEGRLGVDRSEFELQRAEAVQWNNGALGCPEPGQAYTQAIVNGYIVVIEFDSRKYDYRATDAGYFRLCKGFNPAR